MNIKQMIGTAGFFFKKNKTNIAYVSSIGCLIGGTALLVKRSFSAGDKLDEAERKAISKKRLVNPILKDCDISKNDKVIRTEQIKAIIKHYALPVALYAAGIALNSFTFTRQRKQIAGLGMALNGMTAAYTGLLEKIRNELGEDAYQHYKYGMERNDYESVDENGNVVTNTKNEYPDRFSDTPFVWEFAEDNSSEWDRYNPAQNLAKWVELDEKLGVRLHAKTYLTNLEILNAFKIYPRNAKEEKMWETFAITGYRLPFSDERDKAWTDGNIVLPVLGEYSLGSKEFMKRAEDPIERSHCKSYPIQLGGTYIFSDPRLWDNMPMDSITARRYKHV